MYSSPRDISPASEKRCGSKIRLDRRRIYLAEGTHRKIFELDQTLLAESVGEKSDVEFDRWERIVH